MEDKPGRRDPRSSRYSLEYAGRWRLLWVIVGVLAYVAAKYVFGF